MEKHRDYFSFTCDYFPNPSNLNELKKILSEKLQSETLGENEKDMINNDLKRLNVFINMKNQNTNSDCSVIIEENNIIGKKIKMVIDFLKYYKKNCHPIVHMSKKDIDYYLLPRSLFSSNLLYKDEKIIAIEEVLDILFSKNYLNMSEINVDNKIEGKKKLKLN